MDIDFSKAPEGATHYARDCAGDLFWYKKDKYGVLFYVEGRTWAYCGGVDDYGDWEKLIEIKPQTKEQFIERASKIFFDADDGNVNDLSFGALYDAGCRFKGV